LKTVIIGSIINGIVLVLIAIINKVGEYKLQKLNQKNNRYQEYENKKREFYGRMAKCLNVFIENKYHGEEKKQLIKELYEIYDLMWVWANEEILKNIADFIQATINKADDEELKRLHSKVILSMRNDLKMKDDSLSTTDYKFFSFKN
jgi:hypothetical protein